MDNVVSLRGECMDNVVSLRGECMDNVVSLRGECMDNVVSLRGECMDNVVSLRADRSCDAGPLMCEPTQNTRCVAPCLAPCFPTTSFCQAGKEEGQKKENSLSSWVTNPSVPSPPITRDLIVIHMPILSDSTHNLAYTMSPSAAVSTKRLLTATTTTAAISTAISASSQATCTSTALSTAIFTTTSPGSTKHSSSTSAETVESKGCPVPAGSKISETIARLQRCGGDGLSSREDLVKKRQKWALAPIHRPGLYLRSSSESDSVSPTRKFNISRSADAAPPHQYQQCSEQVLQQPCIHPTSNRTGIPRPNYLATDLTTPVTVPCHAVFCAYSTSPEARNLQALLKESVKIHGIKTHESYNVKHGRTTYRTPCCSGGSVSPFLSQYRPTTIGKSAKSSPGTTERNITSRSIAGSRPSCLLCQRSSLSSSRMTRHTRGRQALLCKEPASPDGFPPPPSDTSERSNVSSLEIESYLKVSAQFP
ncbi:putative still life-like [Homarus americanus]|uniref:Putative still life-like n=1 Tax=Homarus americanus TaxID=6706 RepID=A0A8J5MTX5_HOMAM|nr:putative still life-like [Homarus americanus]